MLRMFSGRDGTVLFARQPNPPGNCQAPEESQAAGQCVVRQQVGIL